MTYVTSNVHHEQQTIALSNNYIKVDSIEFRKTAKKLHTDLKKQIDIPTITLSQTQESLAKALGFRNHDAIYQFFNKNTNSLASYKSGSFLNEWEEDDIVKLIISLLSPGVANVFRDRAISLIKAVIKALIFMRDIKEIQFGIDAINKYLIADNLIQLYKVRRDFPPAIKMALKNYLFSTPGFRLEDTIQNDTFQDQHGYLQMQFTSILTTLSNIEQCDPIIFSPRWYHAKYSYTSLENPLGSLSISGVTGSGMNTTLASLSKNKKSKKEITSEHKKIINILTELDSMFEKEEDEIEEIANRFSEPLDNNDKTSSVIKYATQRLDDKKIKILYHKFSDADWINFIVNNKSLSLKNDNASPYIFSGIELINPIRNSRYLEDSWLGDDTFIKVFNNLLKNKQFKTFYLSDLLFYTFKIVNQQKRMLYSDCVLNLIDNYSNIVEYSEILNNLAK